MSAHFGVYAIIVDGDKVLLWCERVGVRTQVCMISQEVARKQVNLIMMHFIEN